MFSHILPENRPFSASCLAPAALNLDFHPRMALFPQPVQPLRDFFHIPATAFAENHGLPV
jgi:hypothetical protein